MVVYRIVHNEEPADLVFEVNQLAADGWRLVGPVQLAFIPGSENRWATEQYVATLVKEKKDDRN